MNCEKVRGQDLVARYVAGDLSGEDMDAFEQHYFGCEECLSAVQIGQAIREGGREVPDDVSKDVSKNEPSTPKVITMPTRPAAAAAPARRWMIPVAAAAAIVVTALVGWRLIGNRPDPVQTAKSEAASPAAVTSQPSAAAAEPREPQLLAANLGAVEPLPYRASVLRGTNEDAAERFRSAMESYTAKDYRKAASRLVSIPVAVPGAGPADEHITDAGIQLYLGISQLLLNQDADAIRSLRRSLQYGDTPYLENARFYLAKGLIRQKQLDEAGSQLRQIIALNGDRRADAQSLLDQLNPIPTR